MPNGNQFVGGQEIDPADYSWSSTYELQWSVSPLIMARPPAQPVAGAYVEPIAIEDGAGRDRHPGIGAHWKGDMPDLRAVRITVRLDLTKTIVWEGEAPRPAEGYAPLGQNLVNATAYEVQMEYQTRSGRKTTPTAWLPVTTFNILIDASLDVLDNSIISSKIANAAITAAKLMDEAVTSIKLAGEAVTTAKIAVGAVTSDVIASGAVIAAKIASGAVTTAKFASGIEPVGIFVCWFAADDKDDGDHCWVRQHLPLEWDGLHQVGSGYGHDGPDHWHPDIG